MVRIYPDLPTCGTKDFKKLCKLVNWGRVRVRENYSDLVVCDFLDLVKLISYANMRFYDSVVVFVIGLIDTPTGIYF